MSPFVFRAVASFFIGGLFDEPMNKGPDSAPLFMAPHVCAKALVECQPNVLSYFDPSLTGILGKRRFINGSGYISSASLKTSHPCGLPL
jgi:hypothetical protein